jgi:hypothetical protein
MKRVKELSGSIFGLNSAVKVFMNEPQVIIKLKGVNCSLVTIFIVMQSQLFSGIKILSLNECRGT